MVVVQKAATWGRCRTSNRSVASVFRHTIWGCVQIRNFLYTLANRKEINSGPDRLWVGANQGFLLFWTVLLWCSLKGPLVWLGSSWLVYLIIFLSSEACYILGGRNATNERGLLWNNQRKQKGAGQSDPGTAAADKPELGDKSMGCPALSLETQIKNWN